jgi:hypothetical protein
VLSAFIEGAQLFLVAGRHASLRDVLVNGAGAYAGAVFYRTMEIGLHRAHRWLMCALSAGAIGTVALTGWLMQRVSTDGLYFGQWVPERPFYAPWNGTLLDARVDGRPTPSGLLRNTAVIRTALESDRPVALTFVMGDPTPSVMSIFTLMDDAQQEILMIGADGVDVVVRPRARARHLYLDYFDQRFPRFLAADLPGDTIRIAVTTDRNGRSCIVRADVRVCATANSLGAAWQLIYWKGDLPLWGKRALHGVTLFLLLMPLAIVSRGHSAAHAVAWLTSTFLLLPAAGYPFGMAWPGGAELIGWLGAVGIALVRPRRGAGSTAARRTS